ncbi:MAG: hypothetical protein H9533_19110 [Rhodobacteraceae bacterium]|nr:hypothetical protein [Paracoccaceae bacterium]
MPPVIARALDVLIKSDGHEAYALRDKFPINIRDIDLFEALGRERNWIFISKDVANASRKPERAALLRSGVLGVYLAPAIQKARINEQAATIIWQWDRILNQRMNNANGLFLLPLNKGSKFRAI